MPPGVQLGADQARPGDVVLLSGPIGLHGVAIMSVREGLEFEAEIASDTQPLNGLVAAMLAVEPGIRVLRDPTRGGLASVLNELAEASDVGMVLDDSAVADPGGGARPRARCSAWTRYHVANEGKLVAIVPAASADAVLAAMRALPEPAPGAARIGTVGRRAPRHGHRAHPRRFERIVDMLVGEQLPRIC